ncbi:MAG: malic enzyme-like NAD(P)-binding protein [Gammaproteobacteria bacterium]|nr:malic enzyme-like NAD(P)-binding protein [Gammaproteobacteria bacterium]
MKENLERQSLEYHEFPRPGKIATEITKPTETQEDLSLAYTPGVAVPVRAIAADPNAAYRYTAKGNLVAVITDGTAVLGLGDVGALAGKPVMEGKGVLFKRFADVDVFDIEVNVTEPKAFIETVERIADTFGGINLEDIAAPRCFEIEEALIKSLDIPVFHDDQHGTAIVISAGLLNALQIQGKKIEEVKIVCLGAGAAAVASMKMAVALGAKIENILMVNRKGVLHSGRDDIDQWRQPFVRDTEARTLADAFVGADVFIGVSGPNLVTAEMLASMAAKPIVFALSNPDPEIDPAIAYATRDDLIMATGRSDYPNQVNNVLCFPFLFRGALDVHASAITEEMKVAAAHAIAEIAHQPVPEEVLKAYGVESMVLGKEYIIPKPFDPRLIETVPAAVAAAARASGVARKV